MTSIITIGMELFIRSKTSAVTDVYNIHFVAEVVLIDQGSLLLTTITSDFGIDK